MKEHIKILDFLRGIAALGVVLYHFATALPTLRLDVMSEILSYGKYGVQVFFVISGFIIPLSMFRSKYRINNFFRYLLKRWVRIDPPSYFSILMTVALYYAAVLILGRPIQGMSWPGLGFTAVFGNLTYTVPYLDTSWYNNVFWTLAIEFQFYIIIGLLFPLLIAKQKYSVPILVSFLALGYIPAFWFFSFGSYFVLGIILFLHREKLLTKTWFWGLAGMSSIACLSQADIAGFIFGAMTFFVILSGTELNFKLTNYLGKISYSLYITHLVVGFVLEIVMKRIVNVHEHPEGKVLLLVLYTFLAVIFARLFYELIEKRFIQYSKNVSASPKVRQQVVW